MPEIKVPIYGYDDIRKKANEFLGEYNKTNSVPVPIEEIIEFKFGINIVPALGLQRDFGVEGFTSSDMKNIYVDEIVYGNIVTRYRFTLAHEIGHCYLHHSLYSSQVFTSSYQWKEFIQSFQDSDRGWLEFQANSFAGLILVPQELLLEHTAECIKKIDEEGIQLKAHWDYAWEQIYDYLGKEIFNVSAEVISRRIAKDGIMNRYKS